MTVTGDKCRYGRTNKCIRIYIQSDHSTNIFAECENIIRKAWDNSKRIYRTKTNDNCIFQYILENIYHYITELNSVKEAQMVLK